MEKLNYDPITTKKIGMVWEAHTTVKSNMSFDVNMIGVTKKIAIKKLELFLKGEPYKHLDNL